jgi:AP-3 complex subunit sigma
MEKNGGLWLQVHTILDEIVMGGQVVETNSAEVLKAVQDIWK